MLATATNVKNKFGKYLKHITDEDGEVIITKNNERVARLVPYVTELEQYLTIKENAVEYEYNRRTVSYEEFMDIYENSNSRMEYINGEIYLLGSPNIMHQAILGDLYVRFKEFFNGKKCKVFIAPFDVHFRKKDIEVPDVMQPDLIVLCDLDVEGNINEKNKYMGTPTLVLEILSPSTRSKDMVKKLNTFMASGISEYWIVDTDNESLILYYFEKYQVESMDLFKKNEVVNSKTFKGLTVNITQLFEELF